jgi:hypothetical protein
MKRSSALVLVLIAAATWGCSGESPTQASEGVPASRDAVEKLDCGSTVRSAKRALRTLALRLRFDGEAQILPLLARPPRFFAVSVSSRDGAGHGNVIVSSRNRVEAARQIAEYGGLRLRIDRFMNAEKPSRTTDFGFWATWKGHRPAVGKAALNSDAGPAIVLAVGIGAQ